MSFDWQGFFVFLDARWRGVDLEMCSFQSAIKFKTSVRDLSGVFTRDGGKHGSFHMLFETGPVQTP